MTFHVLIPDEENTWMTQRQAAAILTCLALCFSRFRVSSTAPVSSAFEPIRLSAQTDTNTYFYYNEAISEGKIYKMYPKWPLISSSGAAFTFAHTAHKLSPKGTWEVPYALLPSLTSLLLRASLLTVVDFKKSLSNASHLFYILYGPSLLVSISQYKVNTPLQG